MTIHQDIASARDFKKRRLMALGLPGGLPGQMWVPRNATARRMARLVRRLRRSVPR